MLDISGTVNSANNSFCNAAVKCENLENAKEYNESFDIEAPLSSGKSASGNANFNSFGNTVIKCENLNSATENFNSLDVVETTHLNTFGNRATNIGITSSDELESLINSAADHESFGNPGSSNLDTSTNLALTNLGGFGNEGAGSHNFGNPLPDHNRFANTGSPTTNSLGNLVSTNLNGGIQCFGNTAPSDGNVLGNPGATKLGRPGHSASVTNLDKVHDRISALLVTSTKDWQSSVRIETRNEIVNQM
jgi:hypothetical protein